jgi:hypothetical protein
LCTTATETAKRCHYTDDNYCSCRRATPPSWNLTGAIPTMESNETAYPGKTLNGDASLHRKAIQSRVNRHRPRLDGVKSWKLFKIFRHVKSFLSH